MRTPAFWYPASGQSSGIWPWLLAPFAAVYAGAGWLRRNLARPYRAPIPIICVGNLTAGGTGKTPVALALAERLLARGIKVHFLTRGYGGKLPGPLLIDAGLHSALEVGDEALLLAALAPTWIARNRKSGAVAACAAGAQMLIMDDGHQNPQLVKDLSLILVDAGRGFGNGWVIPAGPLREPAQCGISRSDVIVLTGEGGRMPVTEKPCLRAHRRLKQPDALRGRNIYAFCGIGAPQQFFDLLSNAGAVLLGVEIFPDHHRFTEQELRQQLAAAARLDAMPVTTEKDWVRLNPALRQNIMPASIEIIFPDEQKITQLLDAVIHQHP